MTDGDAIVYRFLARDEARLLGTIDRAEQIDGVYRQRASALELASESQIVPGWDAEELAVFVARLEAVQDAGGRLLGAWYGPKLVGIASLSLSPVGGDSELVKLDMLYVDAAYRRLGIGRRLTEALGAVAHAAGAARLYISATPSRGTVDAYLHMGARVLAHPDPELFRLEPEDVHLVLALVASPASRDP